MRRVKLLVLVVVAAWSVTALGQAPAGITVFEGARVIVGDTRAPIENASFVVTGGALRAGRHGPPTCKVPAGATRVSLAGKTVMPAIIDTHTHLSQTREMLLDDLRRRAYFGVGRRDEHGPGHDGRVLPGARADDAGPGAVLHRRSRNHRAGTGTHDRAVLGDDRRGSAQGGARRTPRRKSTSSRSGSTIAWAR